MFVVAIDGPDPASVLDQKGPVKLPLIEANRGRVNGLVPKVEVVVAKATTTKPKRVTVIRRNDRARLFMKIVPEGQSEIRN